MGGAGKIGAASNLFGMAFQAMMTWRRALISFALTKRHR
jgi:hypothetical protein